MVGNQSAFFGSSASETGNSEPENRASRPRGAMAVVRRAGAVQTSGLVVAVGARKRSARSEPAGGFPHYTSSCALASRSRADAQMLGQYSERGDETAEPDLFPQPAH